MATESFLAKHASALKYWANAGFAGMICGWLFMVELPAIRKENAAREVANADRDERRMKDYRDERREGLKHAAEAVNVLSDTLRSVQGAVENQTRTLVEVQTITHKNQQRIIDAQTGKTTAKANDE